MPTFNAVVAESVDVSTEVIAGLLDRVAATGLPHCLQARPGSVERLAGLARDRGMTVQETVPLMVLDDLRELSGDGPPEELVIRELGPEEAQLHAHLIADGFEVPVEPFLQLMTPAVLAAPTVRCYVGDVEKEPVATGLGITHGGYIAVFNIATLPANRRRGYGAAVTARAVTDGLAAGATWSWLQSSPAGYDIYERLGFRTVEEWQWWLTP